MRFRVESGHLARAEDVLRQRVRNHAAETFIVAQRAAALCQQSPGRRTFTGQTEEVAGDEPRSVGNLPAVRVERNDQRAIHPPPAVCFLECVGVEQFHPRGAQPLSRRQDVVVGSTGLEAGVHDRGHPDAGVEQLVREPRAGCGTTDYDRARTGLDRVQVQQPAHPAAEHDAGQVVVLEHRGIFVPPRCDDQAFGAQVDQPLALHDAEQPAFVAAEHRSRGQHFDVGLRADALDQTLRHCKTGHAGARFGWHVTGPDLKPQMAAECGLVIDQSDVTTAPRGFVRGTESRGSATDDGYVRMPVFMVGVEFGPRLYTEAAQSGDAAQQLFGQRPRPTRTNERLVVETDGQQNVEFLDQRQRVETERRPGVLGTDAHARADRLGTRAYARRAIDVHQAVGAVARQAQQPARAVIFEAAAEDALPRGVQRRGDGIARLGGDVAAVERERQPPVVVDDVMRTGGKARRTHGAGVLRIGPRSRAARLTPRAGPRRATP